MKTRYLVLSSLVALSALNADEAAVKNWKQKFLEKHEITETPFSSFSFAKDGSSKMSVFTTGAILKASHSPKEGWFWDGFLSTGLSHAKAALDFDGVKLKFSRNVGFTSITGNVGYSWTLFDLIKASPFLGVNSSLSLVSHKGDKTWTATENLEIGAKASYDYSEEYSIGLKASVTHGLGLQQRAYKTWSSFAPRVKDAWGYSFSLPITYKSKKDSKWSYSFEPSFSSSDWKNSKGFFGSAISGERKF